MKIEARPHTSPPTTEVKLGTMTLAELGCNLPHGLLDEEHGRVRTFAFNPPVMRVRKKLGALKTRKGLIDRPGKFISYWLAIALRELGPWDFKAMPEEKAALILGRLPFSDVLYLLLYWQHLSKPEGFSLGKGICSHCGHKFGNIMADLGTLDVSVLEDGPWSALNRPHALTGLRAGFPFGKGENQVQVKAVAVAVPTWADAMWNLQGTQWANEDERAAKLIQAAIIGMEGTSVRTCPESSVDEFWPDDTQRIDDALELVTPTPDLRVKVTCPECKGINVDVIDWQDPGFFT